MQGEEKEIVVSEDDGIRPGVSTQALGGLKTVFKKNGTTTAGNSSQVLSSTWLCSSKCTCSTCVGSQDDWECNLTRLCMGTV